MAPRASGRATAYLLSLPALVFVALLFVLPIGALVLASFMSAKNGSGGHLTLSVYAGLLGDSYNLQLLWRTFKVSALTTFFTLVLAFPVALHLRQMSPRWRNIVSFILISPMLTSVVVRTLAWIILLTPNGVVNSTLVWFGLPRLDLIYNQTGIVIGLTHVLFGYMVLALMTSMMKIDENLLLAASNLGASSFAILRKIIMPLCLPGALAGSILVFSMSASSYATPQLLGGSAAKVVATEIYDLAIGYLEWNTAAGLATILFAVIAIIVGGSTRFAESGRRKAIFG
jgi:putative spermidine/putrescine transport system permease protein